MTKEDVSVEEDCVPRAGLAAHHRPVIHQVAAAPMPSDCEFLFFDPGDPQCREVLMDPRTSIPELFAILRQWVPQVQRNIQVIGNEILKRGCGVNDRDGLTDMSLLHYCCKAGAPGIGDSEAAASFAMQLLNLGADPNLRSRWTNMRALHYAAYFDVPQLIRVVLRVSQPGDIDATCSDFDFGSSLHIAASNLCTSAVRCLLELGANPAFRNDKGQSPADVVPDPLDMPLEMADTTAVAKELRALLRRALPRPRSPPPLTLQDRTVPPLSDRAQVQLTAMGIRLGDRVVIAGQKVGVLQFCGSTEFSGGLWAGVELEKPEGKNDGSVAGVQYFSCSNKHGIFAPLSKISKAQDKHRSSNTKQPIRPRRWDSSRLTTKRNTAFLSRSLSSSSSSLDSRHGVRPPLPRQRLPPRQRSKHLSLSPRTPPSSSVLRSSSGTMTLHSTDLHSRTPSGSSSLCDSFEIHLGERVLVVGQRTGVVQFCGKTSFAPGVWLGIELDKPSGKNDGSVGGVRYFSCPPKHGVFAPPSRVQRIHGSVDCLSELSSSRLSHPLSGTIRRSFSTSTAISAQKEPSRRSSVSRRLSTPHQRRWDTLSSGGNPCSGSDGPVRLHVGMQVLLSSANEMAWVRYVGAADFAPGLWLGLELRSPKGKNDGSVGGRRYFSCRHGYGVLVRPSRVTYRGINGSQLVADGS